MVAVGDVAPDFTLPDQNNEQFSLSSFRGEQAVLLIFYPAAFTSICTGELAALNAAPESFNTDDIETVTISVDSVYSQKIFSERESFEFRLLSDFWPHGGVASQYGVFDSDRGIALRGTFLIDKDGIVRFTEVNQPGEGRDPEAWKAAIAAL